MNPDIEPVTPEPKKSRGLLVPVVSAVIFLLVYLAANTGISYYNTTQNISHNNYVQQKVEQVAIQRAIEDNNKKLCDVFITINKSSEGASHANHQHNSYSQRLEADFKKLAKEYKCGS